MVDGPRYPGGIGNRDAPDAVVDLLTVLREAQGLGFLGPGPVEPHVDHALAMGRAWSRFAAAVPGPTDLCVDLGSGAGLPGLVLAQTEPSTAWVLLDSNQRRTEFLEAAVERLDLGRRVKVIRRRAEEFGRDGGYRGRVAWVFARSFGPPGVTAECAAPLLRPEGVLIVAEPPQPDPTRWPTDGLRLLGLEEVGRGHDDVSWVAFRRTGICPERYPRRVGSPGKRPLF